MTPSVSLLLDIPEDIFIRILLALDFASLSRCKRVSTAHIPKLLLLTRLYAHSYVVASGISSTTP